MAGNNLTINMEDETVEDHLVTLFDKLETIRETNKGIRKGLSKPLQVEVRSLEFWRSIISECLSSFLFVFIVSGAGYGFFNKGTDKTSDTILPVGLATGLSMALLHHCFGKISGTYVGLVLKLFKLFI